LKSDLEIWLSGYRDYQTIQRGRPAASVLSYERSVRAFFGWLSPRGDSLVSASRSDVEAWQKSLFLRGLSDSSRAAMIAAIRSFYDYLIRERVLTGSPTEFVPSPKFRRKSPHKFGVEELRDIFSGPDLEAVRGRRDLAILMVMYGAGPRVAELAGLNLGDVVFGALSCTLLLRGKGGKERVIGIVRTPTEVLRVWHAMRLAEGATDDSPLFTALLTGKGRYGLRLSSEALNDVLKKYAARVGIRGVYAFVHKMRATYATTLYDDGHGILEIAANLGHSDVKTTMRYIAISERAQKAARVSEKRWKELRRVVD